MKNKFKNIENLEVETPFGWKPFKSVAKITKRVLIFKFILEDGTFIEVSLDHIFIINGFEQRAIDLLEGDVLETKNGFQQIIKIELNKKKENVYSLIDVQSSNNSYYTNDIISKNCKFLGSNSTLIDSDILERIVYKIPIMTKWTGLLSIYGAPVPGKVYVLGVDVGKGTQRDSSVIQVVQIDNQQSLKQVAFYRSNQIAPHDFAQVCTSVAKYYNNAYMMVENNDIGHAVCDAVWYELEYENLVNLDPKALGIRSTRKSKKMANLILKEYVEKGWLEIVDERTVYELSRYEEIKPGVFAAGRHEHDDAVTSLLWAIYFVKSEAYEGTDMVSNRIEDDYNVQVGDWESEEVSPNDGLEEQGDPGWSPSVYFDDDI